MRNDHQITTPHTDMRECRRLLYHGSRSFHIASRFLPPTLRESACGLYAFCRIADDLVDLGEDPKQALAELHRRLDLIYAGTPKNHSADRVLSQIVTDHQLPRGLLDALLQGFDWDTAGRSYETVDDLCDYGARVAGTVGLMMAILMGVKDHNSLARAADLGVAMQLTNICRDVGEDARAGRLYLPRQLCRDISHFDKICRSAKPCIVDYNVRYTDRFNCEGEESIDIRLASDVAKARLDPDA